MMTTLGNKKNVKIFSFALAGVFIASVAAMAVVSMGDTANAAPTSDIGVVDQRGSHFQQWYFGNGLSAETQIHS